MNATDLGLCRIARTQGKGKQVHARGKIHRLSPDGMRLVCRTTTNEIVELADQTVTEPTCKICKEYLA